uniref:Rho GTPase-activating protein 39 n=1 Tax=Romanomermis culicivorax TaxID=13658 RepID=A0A915IEG4_ROMCU
MNNGRTYYASCPNVSLFQPTSMQRISPSLLQRSPNPAIESQQLPIYDIPHVSNSNKSPAVAAPSSIAMYGHFHPQENGGVVYSTQGRRRSSESGPLAPFNMAASVLSVIQDNNQNGTITKRRSDNGGLLNVHDKVSAVVASRCGYPGDISPPAHRHHSAVSAHAFNSIDAQLPPNTATLSRMQKASNANRNAVCVAVQPYTTPTQCQCDGEFYAFENLNRHKKGLFRKRQSIQSMLSWSREQIKKPLFMTAEKDVRKEACDVFKRIQAFMGDRKVKKSGIGVDQLALDVCVRGWAKQAIRDEIFIQICKQITENPRSDSVRRGWELLAICLTFFPPSPQFTPYLENFVARHVDPMLDLPDVSLSLYAQNCAKRLERITKSGAKRGLRKPTVEEVEQARIQIFYPSMFGNTLDEVMTNQREKFPLHKLPWIQTTLSEMVLKLNGAQTEGIFRVPGDIDEVNNLKVRMDRWLEPPVNDPHVPASLLKLWYRELADPLVPNNFYQNCLDAAENSEQACLLIEQLPYINRLVLTYLIRFLQIFIRPENVAVTKMDANNLAMVMAPNCLRCQSEDPRIIFENNRKEMTFVKTLMEHCDTSILDT